MSANANHPDLTDYQRGYIDALTQAADRIRLVAGNNEAIAPWLMFQAKAVAVQARADATDEAPQMSATHPQTVAEWAAFLEADPMTLPERLRYIAMLNEWQSARGESEDADQALRAIIPGDGQATSAILDAVATATGRPRIRQDEDGVTNTAPAARAALRRWAARQ